MRLHFGFSKNIKTKTIFKLIGAIIFLVFMTIVNTITANALTIDNPTFTQWGQSYFNNVTSGVDNITIVDYENSYYYKTNSIVYPVCSSGANSIGYNCWNSNNNIQYNQFYSAFSGSSASYFKHITSEFYVNLLNDDYCGGSTESNNKSINFNFNLKFYTSNNSFSSSSLSHFNQSNLYDLFNVYMIAIDSSDSLEFSTACSTTLIDSNNNYASYNIDCSNVFRGNTTYLIDTFKIRILNKIPFNDLYNSSGSDSIWSYFGISTYNSSSSCGGDEYCKFDYSCSNDSPNVEGGGFDYDDDPYGLNDIWGNTKDNLNENILGFDVSNINIRLPQNIQELVSLPIYILQSIVDNSSTCSTYEIDISSLYQLVGDNNSSYTLRLPCMRNVLKNLLGNTFYNLCDMLIACFVFYKVACHLLIMIHLIISGEDLYTYYFKTSETDDESHNHFWNANVNHNTGEVRFR